MRGGKGREGATLGVCSDTGIPGLTLAASKSKTDGDEENKQRDIKNM